MVLWCKALEIWASTSKYWNPTLQYTILQKCVLNLPSTIHTSAEVCIVEGKINTPLCRMVYWFCTLQYTLLQNGVLNFHSYLIIYIAYTCWRVGMYYEIHPLAPRPVPPPSGSALGRRDWPRRLGVYFIVHPSSSAGINTILYILYYTWWPGTPPSQRWDWTWSEPL